MRASLYVRVAVNVLAYRSERTCASELRSVVEGDEHGWCVELIRIHTCTLVCKESVA